MHEQDPKLSDLAVTTYRFIETKEASIMPTESHIATNLADKNEK
jgi:hypothetical protein